MTNQLESLLGRLATPRELAGRRGAVRRAALCRCIAAWNDDLICLPREDARRELRRHVAENFTGYARQEMSRECGAVVVGFLLLTIAGAALSWAVERFLDWWFGRRDGFADLRLLRACQSELSR